MQPLTKTVIENGVPVVKPLYYLRYISTGFPINARAISNTIHPNPPAPGPDQEYLPIMTDAPPDHDPVYTIRTQAEETNETAHQREITYTVEDRPTVEKINAAENVKRLELTKHVKTQDFTENVILTLAAVLREAKGLVLTPKEEALKEQLITEAAILNKNADNFDAIKIAIEDGQKPDLTAGWEVKADVVPAIP